MRRQGIVPFGALLLVVMSLWGCEPPERELQTALGLLAEAKAAEAATYAPEHFTEARTALQDATRAVAAQSGKIRVKRNYEEARELLARAEERALAALREAALEKERIRGRLGSALEGARSGLDGVDALRVELAECPRQPEGFTAEIERSQRRIKGIRTDLESAQQVLDGDGLKEATAAVAAVELRIDTLRSDLLSAKKRIGC